MSKWRILVGDRYGNVIGNISPIAFGKELTCKLNRPAQFTFNVPSGDARVSAMHDDGYPTISEGRSIWAYRNELQQDGSTQWVIRFAGSIWQIEDVGDPEQAWTSVTCFDPLQVLNRRLARGMFQATEGGGVTRMDYSDSTVSFDPYSGGFPSDFFAFTVVDKTTGAPITASAALVADGLLGCTNQYDGWTGLRSAYINSLHLPYLGWYDGVQLTTAQWAAKRSGNFGGTLLQAETLPPNTPPIAPSFDHKQVGEAIVDLTNGYNMFDFVVTPNPSTVPFEGRLLYGSAREWPFDSTFPSGQRALTMNFFRPLADLSFVAGQRGSIRKVTFAWGTGARNVSSISRLVDLETLVNNVQVVGGAGTATALDAASAARFGSAVDALYAQDVVDQAQLAALASESILLPKAGTPTYTLTPGPNAPLPFDTFDVGDTVTVMAGAGLRGGFSLQQRVYGFTLTMDDDHEAEMLTELLTSPSV